ncbi:MAG: hypothetical protein KGM96_05375 [Acidobacteriota bacterium]|nr:hypothetical protein [Acidobacteriota bacterium]
MARWLVVLITLCAFAQTVMPVSGQEAGDSGASRVNAPASSRPAAAVPRAATSQSSVPPAPSPESDGGSSGAQPPQIIVNSPAPAAAPWTWHDRALWGANIVLAVLAYVGIILALRLMKNIDHNTRSSVEASQAALETATAALAQTQAFVDADRPWIVVTVEPFLTMENSFKVMATNRGRTPARLLTTEDHVRIAADETSLPKSPEYDSASKTTLTEPLILLPGESVGIRPFSRDEVRSLCSSDEEFERVELWEDKIFLYGCVTYKDLISVPEKQIHQTDWCCRYIHGETKSALVITGPPEYNKHT